MQTLREKISFTLTALAWLIFHIRTGPDLLSIVTGTLAQILTTLPYAAGFTYILIVVIRKFTGGVTPPWDRILRIFFTLGMFFAFFFALYEYGERAEKLRQREQEKQPSVSQISVDASPKVPLHWA